MSGTPQDQSGTCSRSRSSFFGTAFVDTASTTGGRATFFSEGGRRRARGCAARTREKEGEDDDGDDDGVCLCLRASVY